MRKCIKYTLQKLNVIGRNASASACRSVSAYRVQWLTPAHGRRGCVPVTCYFDIHVAIQQEIFSLEVTVYNLPTVTVINSRQDLPEFASGLRFI